MAGKKRGTISLLALTAGLPALCLAAQAVPRPAAAAVPAADFDRACAEAARARLPDTRITRAELVRATGETVAPGTEDGVGQKAPVKVHRSFCRVAGVVAPAIAFEVWMPAEGWNGRFQGLGLGAFLGKLPFAAMAQALDKGYAVGGTNTGHFSESDDGTWAMADGKLNEQLVGDWTHRGVHEMTVKSKAIVEQVYGRPAHHSYFTGCSSGGFQALSEVQRYPGDYDGVLAGAPASYLTHLQTAQLFFGLATKLSPATDLQQPVDKLPALHKAVLDACDDLDGVKDGLIENPAACRFDPATIACKDSDGPACLTGPQVEAVRRIYADVTRRDGSKVFPGLPMGSELQWSLMAGGYLGNTGQVEFAQSFYRYFVFQDPAWSYKTMDLDRDLATADRRVGRFNANNPDIGAFRARGGKLIQYHGWADWGISPYSSIDYFKAVATALHGSASPEAVRQTQDFYRLFMIPGMSHCRGGAGPDVFDGLGALVAWVEQGQAPARMTVAKLENDKPVRTRTLCVWPEVAHYKGRGSTDEAENFKCRPPA